MASSAYSTRRQRRRQRLRQSAAAISPATQRVRLLLVGCILAVAMVAIAGRLVWLQLVQGGHLAGLAAQQRQVTPVQRQVRHPIVDRSGNVLAVDRVVYTLYAHPQLFDRAPQAVAEALSPLLDVPTATLLSRFSRQPTGIRLVDGMPEAIADRLRALRLNGLELHPQQQRFYPYQQLVAPIVGFVNLDGQPQAGLELVYQEELALLPAAVPETGPAVAEPGATDSAGLSLPEEAYGPPLDGLLAPEPALGSSPEDAAAGENPESETGESLPWQRGPVSLQLTLDSRLQRTAQRALQATVQRHRAKRGTVMVIDAHSGEMLALASMPTYDPNQYFKADLSDLRNWTISDLYEPGSTFKPINIAIALEAGLITPDELVNDSGQMQFGEWVIRNHDYVTTGGRGAISITDVLKYSSNVGMMRIMQKMSAADYFVWLQQLGLDRTTGVDLPAEAAGQIKDRENFLRSRVELATTSFGQGFSITPIKMLQLQAALANGGKLVTPHVVKGLIDDAGQFVWTPEHPNAPTVFSSRTTQQVLTMLEAVVDTGTGGAAKLPGYRIGGKTGTAQKATATGGYGRGRVTSFAAILPIDAPRYVVLAVIDEPQGDDAYGSTVAAPLVKEVTEALVVLEGLPPSAAP